MKEWICCGMLYEHCRVCVLILQFRAHPDVVTSLETKELIHRAKSDITNLFCNFETSIGEIPLTSDVHGSDAVLIIFRCCVDQHSESASPAAINHRLTSQEFH